MNTRPRTIRWPLATRWLLVPTCLSSVACLGDPDSAELAEPAVGEAQQAVYGAVSTRSCDAGQQAYLRNVMVLGRSIVVSPAFGECLDRAIRTGVPTSWGYTTIGPYDACDGLSFWPGDPYHDASLATKVSRARDATLSIAPIEVTCSSGNSAFVEDYGSALSPFSPGEEIDLAMRNRRPTFSTSQADYADQADSLWHEVMHQWGYDHVDDGGNTCFGQADINKSMPYIVEFCVQHVSRYSEQRCADVACPGAMLPVVEHYPSNPEEPQGCHCVRDPRAPVLGNAAQTNVGYGSAIAVGDFDGDKFADAAIGAPFENNSTGAVYLYRGSEFGLQPWKVLRGPAQLTQFGASLAAGDLNGDGLADLAVGAPTTGSSAGYVHLYRGHASDGLVFSRKLGQSGLDSDEAEDLFGSALAMGQVFGNGLPGLVVGAPGERVGSVKSGLVFVFEGINSNQLVASRYKLDQFMLDTNENGDRFGQSIALGDFNADGAQAMVIGAPGDKGVGRVYLYAETGPGATSGSAMLSMAPHEPEVGMAFGQAVAVGHGIGGAGENLVAIGSPYARGGKGTVTFHALVEWLPLPVFNRVHATFEGSPLAYFGMKLQTIQVDGQDQVMIGAVAEGSGRVYSVLRASDDPLQGHMYQQFGLNPETPYDWFGSAMASGDFDYDGVIDLLIGAPGNTPSSGSVMHWNGTAEGPVKAFRLYDKQR